MLTLLSQMVQGAIVGLFLVKVGYYLLVERIYRQYDNGPTGVNHIRHWG